MGAESEKPCHPVTVSEAFHLLHPLKHRYRNTRSYAYKIYKETLDYAERFCKMKDKSLADDIRSCLADLGFSEDEIAALGSLFPQSSDEAKICVPTITRLGDSTIDSAIEKLQHVS